MSDSLSHAGNGHQRALPAEIDSRPLPVRRDEPVGPAVGAGRPALPVIAAGGGFLAGIVTLAIVRGLSRRLGAVSPRRRRRRRLEVAGSRSFLIDVHVLKR